MIPIDTIVSIKSGDEYGGKYTGKQCDTFTL